MLVYAAVGVSAAAALVSIVEALRAYPRLPSRMPLRFGLNGEPRSFGPKMLFVGIFCAIAVALCVEVAMTFFNVVPSARVGETRGVWTAAAAVVFVAYLQHTIIDATSRHGMKLSMTPFWIATTVLCGIAVVTGI